MPTLLPAALLVVSLAAAQTTPQTTPSADAAKGTIHLEGKVVSVTGGVLEKATAELQNRDRPREVYQASTDGDGKFVFDGVLPGRYVLSAGKTGYLHQLYGAISAEAVLTLSDGQEMRGLDITLTPQATISGRVLELDGDPLQSMTVELLRYGYAKGQKQLQSISSVVTDDRGEFRISGLPAGRYYLRASPRSVGPAAQEVNIVTFYPNVREAVSASPVNLAAGDERFGVDIRMKRAQVYSLQGQALDSSTGQPASGGTVSIGSNLGSFFRTAQLRPNGSFEFLNLPSGTYVLYTAPTAARNASLPCLTGRLDDVTIRDSSIKDAVMVLRPCAQVAGSIRHDEDLRGPDQQSQGGVALRNSFLGVGTIGLQPADGLALGYRAQLKDDGTFTLPSVGLSAFYVNVVGLRSNAYVKSIRSGTQDITNQPLDLSSGSAGPLDIVVSSKAAEVSGTVRTRKGEAMFGVRVTLWPKSPIPGRVAGGVRQAATDQNGGFQLTGLPPGDYFLAAWEVLDPGLAVAEFLALFNTVASPINLLESAKQNLNLEPILSDRVTAELDKLP